MDLTESETTFVQQSLAYGDDIEITRHRKAEPYASVRGVVGRRIDTATVRIQWHEGGEGFFPHPDVFYSKVVVRRGPNSKTFERGCEQEYNAGRHQGHVLPATESDDSAPRARPARNTTTTSSTNLRSGLQELWKTMQGLAAEMKNVSGLKPEIENRFEEFYVAIQKQQTSTQALADDIDDEMANMQRQIDASRADITILSNERQRVPQQIEHQIMSTQEELEELRNRVSAERAEPTAGNRGTTTTPHLAGA